MVDLARPRKSTEWLRTFTAPSCSTRNHSQACRAARHRKGAERIGTVKVPSGSARIHDHNCIRRGASFIPRGASFPFLIPYAVSFKSFFQNIIIRVRQAKLTLGLVFRVRCRSSYFLKTCPIITLLQRATILNTNDLHH